VECRRSATKRPHTVNLPTYRRPAGTYRTDRPPSLKYLPFERFLPLTDDGVDTGYSKLYLYTEWQNRLALCDYPLYSETRLTGNTLNVAWGGEPILRGIKTHQNFCHHNLKKNKQILISFGTNFPDTTGHQMTV